MKAEAPSCEMGVHSVAYTSFAHRYPRQQVLIPEGN